MEYATAIEGTYLVTGLPPDEVQEVILTYQSRESVTAAFTVLEMLGLGDVIQSFFHNEANSLCNTLTAAVSLRVTFDQFICWLGEVQGQVGSYTCVFPLLNWLMQPNT